MSGMEGTWDTLPWLVRGGGGRGIIPNNIGHGADITLSAASRGSDSGDAPRDPDRNQ